MADLMPLHEADLHHLTTAIGHVLDAMNQLNKTVRSDAASEAIVKAVDTLTCMIERFEVNEQGGGGSKV